MSALAFYDLRAPSSEQQKLGDLVVHASATRIFAPLKAPSLALSPDRLGFLWHEVRDRAAIKITVRSLTEKHRKVRLRLRALDRRFQVRWTRWNPHFRKVRELQGGEAVDALDNLSESDNVLTYYLMGEETRTAGLEVIAELSELTRPGEYKFELIVEDITADETESSARIACSLNLFHLESNLLSVLPSIYEDAMRQMEQDEEGEKPPFFVRYLRGFEDVVEPLKATLDALDLLFGPYSTPPDFLLWLGAWVCARTDDNWPEMKRRRLISEAVELYRWRGTRKGLSRYIEIYTGVVPEIDDRPSIGMRLGPEAKLGTEDTILGDIPPHTFVVTVAVPDLKKVNEDIVREIIRYEKPAHTGFHLQIVERIKPTVVGQAS